MNWLKVLKGILVNGASAEDAKVTGSMIMPIAQRRISKDKTKVRAEINAQKIACIVALMENMTNSSRYIQSDFILTSISDYHSFSFCDSSASFPSQTLAPCPCPFASPAP